MYSSCRCIDIMTGHIFFQRLKEAKIFLDIRDQGEGVFGIMFIIVHMMSLGKYNLFWKVGSYNCILFLFRENALSEV